MRSEQRQQLSTLVDRAIDGAETAAILDALASDPELRACWARYHLIRDVLRGEAVSCEIAGVADQVAARLAREAPLVSAPRPAPFRRRTRLLPPHWPPLPVAWLPLAGAMLVASAAVLLVGALLGPDGRIVPPVAGLAEQHPGSDSLTQIEGLFAAVGAPVPVVPPDHAVPFFPRRWDIDEPLLESKLSRLLVGHHDAASGAGIHGIIPYIAVVGYGGDR